MQHMYQDGPDKHTMYSGYAGNDIDYDDHLFHRQEQKLHVDDDEQFADILARRIRQELRDELQAPRNASSGPRVALAITSMIALVLVFAFLALIVIFGHISTDASIAVGWSIVLICITIMSVNGSFYWASRNATGRERRSSDNNRNENDNGKSRNSR